MIKATDEERKEILLYNGLYTTAEVLLKNLHEQCITIEEYISESRKMFELWEQLKENNNEQDKGFNESEDAIYQIGYEQGRAEAIEECIKHIKLYKYNDGTYVVYDEILDEIAEQLKENNK